MDIERNHIIHSRGGKLGAADTSSRADVERILAMAQAANPARGLAIHFHGGLVPATAGRALAQRLGPVYAGAGTHPLFFVWESGAIETLRNNLGDILGDSVFQELVKKVSEWALKELGDGITTRGHGGAAVNVYQLRTDFDRWFAEQADTPPVTLESPPPRVAATKGVEPDEDELAERIELELDNDEDFQKVMAGLYVASGRGVTATTKGGSPPAVEVEVLVDNEVLDELFPPTTVGTTKSVLTWWKVAKFAAKIVIAVIRRHWNKRDHGTYTTIVEEVLRAAYLDRVGAVVWRMMKKDTADAFLADPDCVGSAALNALAKLAAEGKSFSHIALIGHSTGAVYINAFIRRAAATLPGVKFNVIFLAPANRFEDFDEVLTKHQASIANFRMFSMTDAVEAQDQLVPIIYPRSLLYLISGVLEGEADVPIMGMQRFKDAKEVFNEADFPAIHRVRGWLDQQNNRSVWSISGLGVGLNSSSRKHGDFDNDETTVASVIHALSTGY